MMGSRSHGERRGRAGWTLARDLFTGAGNHSEIQHPQVPEAQRALRPEFPGQRGGFSPTNAEGLSVQGCHPAGHPLAPEKLINWG